jgi:CRISPR/Cas system-associated exonuclease Cas4 (RecB family)
MIKSISASAINSYYSCPRKFYLQYILKLKSPVESPHLKLGSDIHSKLSQNVFESEDLVEHAMLQNGKKFIDNMPSNPVKETTYSDKSNPGRFFGEIFGLRAVGIFDLYWPPEECIGADFKSGSFYKSYTSHFDMQSWILNELFKQKFNKPLKRFYFPFLKTGEIYEPPCIKDEKENKKVEKAIKKIVDGMEEEQYGKKCGNLCDSCGLSCFCCMDL